MPSPDPARLQPSANLTGALGRLYARHTFGIKLGLDPVRRLCELIGNPQDQLAVVHVAGTNGKGSVSAMIEAVLRAAGLRTGLYTSPHMVRFNERIRIGGQEVGDPPLVAALELCEQAAGQVQREQGHEATFFEITTAMAFHCFRQAGVQVAVVETGMGGRLDATNIVQPLVSVITRIAMDHEAYLGNTLEAVAGEKAGIIKAGRPIVAGPQEPAAEEVLRQAAAARGAPYLAASEAVAVRPLECSLRGQKVHAETTGGWSGMLRLPLSGAHQLENLAIALTALEQVFSALGTEVPFRIVREGLAAVQWRGRFEVLREAPTVIADAAHNPSGAATLAAALRTHGLTRTALVTGMCADKDTAGVARILAGVARRVWTVPIPNARSLPAEDLAALFRRAGVDAQATDHVEPALREAEAWAKAEGSAVVIAGSIFLLGEVLPLYANPQ
jgi:dihydrofolate synthase/folylpolyglutamate synthase